MKWSVLAAASTATLISGRLLPYCFTKSMLLVESGTPVVEQS